MAGKSGREYAQDVRDLRAAGVEFASASRGYTLADAANWGSGQKAAVTRAINEIADDQEFEETPEVEGGLSDAEAGQFFDDAAGDEFEEYDDIDFFDPAEAEEFVDEESDAYSEAEA